MEYAEKKEIVDGIIKKYHPEWLEETWFDGDTGDGGQSLSAWPAQELHQEQQAKKQTERKGKSGGMKPVPPARRFMPMEKPLEEKT